VSTRPAADNPRKFCSFPGCVGGCHFCFAVREQRAGASLHAVAKRALAGSPTEDVRLLAEYVERDTAPVIDEETWKWL
jgi:hypothetical protein